MGMIPKKIRVDQKLPLQGINIKGFTMQKGIGVVIILALGQLFNAYIHASLYFVFIITCIAIFLVLMSVDTKYPVRKKWGIIIAYLCYTVKPKKYKPIISHGIVELMREEE